MNKLVTVLGVAAVATLAGCKDPNYKPMGYQSQNEVKTAAPTEPVDVPEVHCTCPVGTKHTTPCVCGAPDCKCEVVEPTPVNKAAPVEPTPPVATKPIEPEYTIYIVQKGDYLAKISKKYNVTINSIKELNGLKNDKIRLGQKLKLPGKIDVGEQTVPEGAIAKPVPVKKAYTPYTGETIDYTVKSGDTLGAIAYGNGINIRQLKELNGLSKDDLKIGQKLKIPANGKAVKSAPKVALVKAEPVKELEVVEPIVGDSEPTLATPAEPTPVEPTEVTPAEVTPAESAPVPATEDTYVVQEGEDLMAISIASGVSLSTLREINNLPEDAKLTAGQVLKLPAEE